MQLNLCRFRIANWKKKYHNYDVTGLKTIAKIIQGNITKNDYIYDVFTQEKNDHKDGVITLKTIIAILP